MNEFLDFFPIYFFISEQKNNSPFYHCLNAPHTHAYIDTQIDERIDKFLEEKRKRLRFLSIKH